MIESTDLKNDFERFERELAMAEKDGQEAICKAVRRGIGSLNRTFHGFKRQMIIRGAEALEKTVSDPHTISRLLKKSLKGQVGEDYVHQCLDEKYKCPRHAENASMRGKVKAAMRSANATPITLDDYGIVGPETCNSLNLSAPHNVEIAAEPPAVTSSCVGITVAQGEPIVLEVPFELGNQVFIKVDNASLPGLSGKVVLTLIVPVTAVATISAIRGLTPGYHEESKRTKYTEFINRAA